MKQMVYVVLDNGEVVGVYNKYEDAENVASETATITPVLVDKTDDCRVGCNTPSEVVIAMEHELSSAPSLPYNEDEDDAYEDEDEDDEIEDDDEDSYDEDDEDDDEDEEEEDDPIAAMVYMIGDTAVIAKSDADTIMEMMHDVIELRAGHLSEEEKRDIRNRMFTAMCHDYGIEGIDENE